MFRVFNSIKKKYYGLINFIMLGIFGCKSSNMEINGKLFFRCYGEFRHGLNLVINSSFASNPIGGNTFCSIVICDGSTLSIGDNVGISNSAIYCATKITIDNDVLIGGDCKIYDTDFHSLDAETRLKKDDKGKQKEVRIGAGVFIGTGSIILKGTKIGKNSVIGAGSVVSGTIPEGQIWAGNPVKYIRDI